ncbi:hypothetical protein SPRG_06005 [Saprolegnia parasitica CBS 223.65]|uniref:Uncharacterized protein n=1 Tax=Saprolegnia parasitica (strain CBS 223.65) TaxID=695850 RepID=A0A067CRN0_SAPPC|nr:hypothetical protein SPRG_06005 [Saprolegnia parasitica CBS 223.65]KDO29467.1 hypothetical protein SPRG_06005 [Saprolegnia parasitica CBS 223.65]|eukprot:XP_012199966.1 hypothetical protein SPRG_06005 [Saprolegnia parasitica CBS 223.65]
MANGSAASPDGFPTKCKDWKHLDEELERYMHKTNSCFVAKRTQKMQSYLNQMDKKRNGREKTRSRRFFQSATIALPEYRRKEFMCVEGEKSHATSGDKCPFRFIAQTEWDAKRKEYSIQIAQKNLVHNHELSAEAWRRYPSVKRMLWDESCQYLLEITHAVKGSRSELFKLIEKKHPGVFTMKDIHNRFSALTQAANAANAPNPESGETMEIPMPSSVHAGMTEAQLLQAANNELVQQQLAQQQSSAHALVDQQLLENNAMAATQLIQALNGTDADNHKYDMPAGSENHHLMSESLHGSDAHLMVQAMEDDDDDDALPHDPTTQLSI